MLTIQGYTDVDPQAPLGGPDDKKDILSKRGGKRFVGAVYFPSTHQTYGAIRKKFEDDREGVDRHAADGFVFLVGLPPGIGRHVTCRRLSSAPAKDGWAGRSRSRSRTAGQLSARITATRLVLTGPLALGLRKKVDTRELYLLIEGHGWAISVPVDPTLGAKAREFAAKINAAGMTSEPDNTPAAAGAVPPADIPDQIRKLGELRDAGLLTAEEFDVKKAELLDRM